MTILCESDRAAAAALRAALESVEPVETVPDLASAASLIEAEADEDLVVVGTRTPLAEVIQFTRTVQVARPTISVLLLRQTHEPKAAEAALAAGVCEVLPVDDSAKLAAAVQALQSARVTVPPPGARASIEPTPLEKPGDPEPPLREAAEPTGRVITVFAPKGGSGKTTIATNLAVALNRAGRRVCLIDLDLEFGDVAISLRMTPVRTLADAVVPGFGRAHEDVQSLVIAYADGMDCILAPVEPGEAGKIPANLVTDLVGQLRKRYEYIVIDTPSQFSEHVLAALDASDLHVLLTNPELPALKSLRLTLDMFDLLGYERDRRSIIFNREDGAVGLTAADAENAINSPLAVHVPASRDVTASINRGVPLVAAKPDHPVSAAIRGFARTLTTEPGTNTKGSGRRTRFLRRRAG